MTGAEAPGHAEDINAGSLDCADVARFRVRCSSRAERDPLNDAEEWNRPIIEEFRATGGSVDSRGFGRNLVLLHHIGAQSGAERVVPTLALREGHDTWLITASAGGGPTNPGWYFNLLAQPDVAIETPDDGVVPVHADLLLGEERDRAWRRFTSMSAGFAYYETQTTRIIPVFALRRP
jgi:deazaflavin-dependent oxidoreductase (nitroreductase family)